MQMLRYSLGKTRMDKIRNEVVRRETGVGELRGKLKETKLRWLGHIVKRNEGYVGKRMKTLTVGKMEPCRPKKWGDYLKEDIEQHGHI